MRFSYYNNNAMPMVSIRLSPCRLLFFFLIFFQAYVLPQGYVLGLSLMFTAFLPSLLHYHRALLSCHRWRMNKYSNFKIHGYIYTYCLNFISKSNPNLEPTVFKF